MQEQVLSIEQMKHLHELGLDTSNASMCWMKDLTKEIVGGKEIDMSKGWFLDFNNPDFYKYEWMDGVPTFTLQDILDLLPQKLRLSTSPKESFSPVIFLTGNGYIAYVSDLYSFNFMQYAFDLAGESLIDAAYKMLCCLINNGYIPTSK